MLLSAEISQGPSVPRTVILAALVGLLVYLLSISAQKIAGRLRRLPTEAELIAGRVESRGQWKNLEHRLEATGQWPEGPQVYAHYNEDGKCVYVGQSVNLKQRFNDHGKSRRALEDEWTHWRSWGVDRKDLNRVERGLIRLWNPKGNVQKYKGVKL